MVSRRAEQIQHAAPLDTHGGVLLRPPRRIGRLLLGRARGQQASTSSADYQFDLLKGKPPIGVSVPTTALVDVGFAGPQDGFALAVHRGDVFLAASTDGGTTWQVRSEDLPAGLGADDGYPGQFEFIGSTGYLWGDRSAGLAPLWVSHDDGATWHVAHLGPYVIDASAIGTNVWALTSSVRPLPQRRRPFAPWASNSQSTRAHVDAVEVPALNGGLAAGRDAGHGVGAHHERTRLHPGHDANGPTASPGVATFFTAGLGGPWTSRVVPCSGAFDLGAEVAASSTEDLWLLCGSQATCGRAVQAALPVRRRRRSRGRWWRRPGARHASAASGHPTRYR